MQALWSTLHNPYDNVATVAYRVLGKFGGSNRKMLSTPQPVSTINEHQPLTCTVEPLYNGHHWEVSWVKEMSLFQRLFCTLLYVAGTTSTDHVRVHVYMHVHVMHTCSSCTLPMYMALYRV